MTRTVRVLSGHNNACVRPVGRLGRPAQLVRSECEHQQARGMADVAAYDIWDVSWFDEPVKCVAGLIAAFISTSKIYDSEFIASQGK